MDKQPKSTDDAQPVTRAALARMKRQGTKIACLTAYDASFAALLDMAGIDVMLVGDTLGMVVQGHATTVPVTVDDMVYHTRMVARGRRRALLMADLPFASYATPMRALDSAARLMQEGGAQMVKLEGSGNQAEIVRYLSDNGVPVCAHLGLRPQLVHKLGGFKVQGRSEAAAKAMLADARVLEEAGADILLLECVPTELAAEIAANADAPVIGIGAGAAVDGQILVLYDMLGITPGHKPRFAKDFLAGGTGGAAEAVRAYIAAVRDGSYPAAEHSFK
jgi:3-methyl-2-oxobutanoate hydroxymethyltransferase